MVTFLLSRNATVAVALAVMAGPASAQSAPGTTPAAPAPAALEGAAPTQAPDITNTNPAAPLAGANSFTGPQVRRRLEANGFTQVSALRIDRDGIWRGTATKAGKPMAVAVDYQGNITAK